MEAIRIFVGFLRIGRLQNLFQGLLRLKWFPKHPEASSQTSVVHEFQSRSGVPPSVESSIEMGQTQLFLHTYPMRLSCGLDSPTSDFYASIPERGFRYHRETKLLPESDGFEIQPQTIDFSLESPPHGWEMFVHPEGICYFFDRHHRLFTDANLYDPAMSSAVMKFVEELLLYLDEHSFPFGDGFDIVLDVHESTVTPGRIVAGYYFVSHQHRSVFWVDTVDSWRLTDWRRGVQDTKPSDLQYEIESQYWYHCMMYPIARPVDRSLVHEWRDTIIFYIGDTLTSSTSTSPHTTQNLETLLNVAQNIIDNDCIDLGGTARTLYDSLSNFARQKSFHLYGRANARLNKSHDVFSSSVDDHFLASAVSLIISPLFFFVPDAHLQKLGQYLNELAYYPTWVTYLDALQADWQQSTLFATVLLASNVGFLAIQSVDTQTASPRRSPIQVLSYISVFLSIGTIVAGLFLLRHQGDLRVNISSTIDFMREKQGSGLRLQGLAILYSIPSVTLLWGMISFLVAFSILCFQGTAVSVYLPVAIIFAIVTVLSAFCISSITLKGNPDGEAVVTKVKVWLSGTVTRIASGLPPSRRTSSTSDVEA